MKKLWMISACLMIPGLALAQDNDNDFTTKDLSELTTGPVIGQHFPRLQNALCRCDITFCNGFDFYGYVDTSYNYLHSNHFTSGVPARVFDLATNGFTLQEVALTVDKLPDTGFGGSVTVIIGRDANETAAYGWDPYYGSQTLAIDPLEAYLQYAWTNLTIMGGKFESIADVEDLDNTLNTNFSHSILFGYTEPGTVLGLRGIYDVNNRWELIFGLNNGWDTIRDFKRYPTIELGVSYQPNSRFNLSGNVYTGQMRLDDFISTGPKSWRTEINVYGTYNLTDRLALVGNTVYGWQNRADLPDSVGEATWGGIAGYVIYSFTDQWKGTVRAEYFADNEGFRTGVAQKWKEITLTLGYSPIKCFELRAETRHDFSNESSFVDAHGNGTSNYNQSYALEAIYKFGYPSA